MCFKIVKIIKSNKETNQIKNINFNYVKFYVVKKKILNNTMQSSKDCFVPRKSYESKSIRHQNIQQNNDFYKTLQSKV